MCIQVLHNSKLILAPALKQLFVIAILAPTLSSFMKM